MLHLATAASARVAADVTRARPPSRQAGARPAARTAADVTRTGRPVAAGECSAAVAALVALVTPLPYAADFRPYFTIHDPAFAALAGGQLPAGASRLPRLLGITNLYILKVLAMRGDCPATVVACAEGIGTAAGPAACLATA